MIPISQNNILFHLKSGTVSPINNPQRSSTPPNFPPAYPLLTFPQRKTKTTSKRAAKQQYMYSCAPCIQLDESLLVTYASSLYPPTPPLYPEEAWGKTTKGQFSPQTQSSHTISQSQEPFSQTGPAGLARGWPRRGRGVVAQAQEPGSS